MAQKKNTKISILVEFTILKVKSTLAMTWRFIAKIVFYDCIHSKYVNMYEQELSNQQITICRTILMFFFCSKFFIISIHSDQWMQITSGK